MIKYRKVAGIEEGQVDLYLRVLELGLDTRTWVDYVLERTREGMKGEPSVAELSDIAAGVDRLDQKVQEMKRLLADYLPVRMEVKRRQYESMERLREAFEADEGYHVETLLGRYYAVGTPQVGYDIQFLTPELLRALRADHPDWQVQELSRGGKS